jgi:hypothetical protein
LALQAEPLFRLVYQSNADLQGFDVSSDDQYFAILAMVDVAEFPSTSYKVAQVSVYGAQQAEPLCIFRSPKPVRILTAEPPRTTAGSLLTLAQKKYLLEARGDVCFSRYQVIQIQIQIQNTLSK